MKIHSLLLGGFLLVHLSAYAYNEGIPDSVAMSSRVVDEEGVVRPVVSELRQRQPHWKPRITSLFPDGSAERAVFYEISDEGKELAVKEIRYFASGQLKMEGDLLDLGSGEEPIPHGVRVTYHVNGVPEQLAYYDRGKLHGPLQFFYPNGQLKRLEMMEGGERNGKWEVYDEDGSKREVAHYVHGKIVGDLLSFYPNGVKSASLPYGDAGVPHGVATEWFESGSIKANRRYRDGLLSGDGWNPAVTIYYENQTIAEVQDFQGGSPVGVHFQYYEDGREAYRASYKDGKKHGAEQWLFADGSVRGYGEWQNGVPVGKHWTNHATDQLATFAEYDQQGRLVRPIVEFHENGVKRAEYLLVGEQPEGEAREWYDNGQLKTLYVYRNGKYEGEQTEYYPSGQMRVRSLFREGVRQGLHEEWHENGQLAARVQHVNGERDGECMRWYPNGKRHQMESYQVGVLHGKSAVWWEDGTPKFEVHYCNGEQHGWCREWSANGVLVMEAEYEMGGAASDFRQWHENGQLACHIPVVNGKREGKEERFYPSGARHGVATFHNDQLDGEVAVWYEDGSPMRTQQFKEGIPVGLHKEYFQPINGKAQLARIVSYAAGKLDGEQRSYHKNGQVQAIVSYCDGVLNGMKALWDEEGNLMEEGWYEMGDLQGRFFHRDPEGREIIFHYKGNQRDGLHQVFYPAEGDKERVKAFEATYVNGKLEGEVAEYSEQGVKMATTFYRQGKKHGTSRLYSEDSRLVMTVEFVDDVNHGPLTHYFPNGKVLKRVNFVDGKKQGDEVAYYLDGQLASTYPYEMGLINGVAREWNEKGQLVFEAEYQNGVREGRFNKYYENGKPQVEQTYRQDKLHGIKRIYNPQGQVTEVRYEHGKRVYG